ncbi:MAG: hypothetical protein ACJ8KA_12520 [Sulfurifustis sp.]
MIYRIAKEVLLQTADQLQAIDACKAQTLRHASTQWLRQGPRVRWIDDVDTGTPESRPPASETHPYDKSA